MRVQIERLEACMGYQMTGVARTMGEKVIRLAEAYILHWIQ